MLRTAISSHDAKESERGTLPHLFYILFPWSPEEMFIKSHIMIPPLPGWMSMAAAAAAAAATAATAAIRLSADCLLPPLQT